MRSDHGRQIERLRTAGGEALACLSNEELTTAWQAMLDSLEDALVDPALVGECGLSKEGLRAGLSVLAEGCSTQVLKTALAKAPNRIPEEPRAVTIVLASTPPALVLQVLLPALAMRCPVLIKVPSRTPSLTRHLIERLLAAEPRLAPAIAMRFATGGEDLEAEEQLYAATNRIVAYGDLATLEDLKQRFGEAVIAHGPGLSVALIEAQNLSPTKLEQIAEGLARDIALFDQRGCLSLHWIFVSGSADQCEPLSSALTRALEQAMHTLPPGPLQESLAIALNERRTLAEMNGDTVHAVPGSLTAGTVIESETATPTSLIPSPGGRLVTVCRCEPSTPDGDPLAATLQALTQTLEGRLQGVVLDGALEQPRRQALESLATAGGVTHTCHAGKLQHVTALWPNGGLDPLAVFSCLL